LLAASKGRTEIANVAIRLPVALLNFAVIPHLLFCGDHSRRYLEALHLMKRETGKRGIMLDETVVELVYFVVICFVPEQKEKHAGFF
jgi:hypothetical protein